MQQGGKTCTTPPTMAQVNAAVFETLAGSISANLLSTVSIQTRERRFKAFFGTTASACSMLWSLCSQTLLAKRAMPVHLLWGLMFLKQYNKEEVNASMTGCDEKTFRLWSWLVIRVLADLDTLVRGVLVLQSAMV
jgi:hypothetical protein